MGAEVGCVTVIDVGAALVGIDVLVGEVRRGVVAGGASLIAVSVDNSGKQVTALVTGLLIPSMK